MTKNIITKTEMETVFQFNKKYENYLLMPNEIIPILVGCKELVDSTAVAVAYSYTYLITFLYRYAKYGALEFEETSVKSLKRMLGLSPTNNTYDYIIKKGGVLDRLNIVKTLSMTESPISVVVREENDFEFPDFTLFNEIDDDFKDILMNGQTMKKRTFKYPLMALEEREPVEGFGCNGTYFGGGKDYTHMIPLEVFIKCMTNPELGCTAFYLYSFIRSRYGKNKKVQISLNGISNYSGVRATTRDKYLKLLRQYGMVGVEVQDFVVGRDDYGQNIETESNTYWVYEDEFYSLKEDAVKTRKVVSIFNMPDIDFSDEAKDKKKEFWKKAKSKEKIAQ